MNGTTRSSEGTLGGFLLGHGETIRLDTFRVCLAITLLIYQGVWWRHAKEWLTSAGFHVSSEAAGGYGPVAPLLAEGVLPLFGLLHFGAILCVIVGWRLRFTIPMALVLVIYVTYADPLTAFTLNRLYIASLAILAFGPGGMYWTIDRPAGPASVWPVRVHQATLVIQYFTAGWCKAVHGDWVANPYVMWSQSQGWYMTDIASWALRTAPAGLFSWMQYMALSFELAAPLLFMVRRLRPIGYAFGFIFHVGTALIAYQLEYFSLQMLCFYTLFMDEDRLRRVHAAVAGALSRGWTAVRPPRPVPAG